MSIEILIGKEFIDEEINIYNEAKESFSIMRYKFEYCF